MATMSARYTVIDGEVVAQERGGVRHQLVPDPLGSTIALYDSAGTKTDTLGYWPYGENSSRTGTTVVKFQYVGTKGYFNDNDSQKYVRARYLSSKKSLWITKDPLNLKILEYKIGNSYVYVSNRPISIIDSTRFGPGDRVPCPPEIGQAKKKMCDAIKQKGKDGIVSSGCCTGPLQSQCLINWCNNDSNVYCIKSGTGGCKPDPPSTSSPCAFSYGGGGVQRPGEPVYICIPKYSTPGCGPRGTCKSWGGANILHELMHLCGSGDKGGYPDKDPAENRAQCLCGAMGL